MKIRSLAEEFPDAKFVYLIRNPFETVPSLLELISTIWQGLGLDSDHVDRSTRELASGCLRDYNYAFETLAQLPDHRYAIVEYSDLVADPKATVEKVYDRLELSLSPAFDQRLAAERTRQKRYQSENVYSLAAFGLSEAELLEKIPHVIERFGFRPEDVPDRQTSEML